MISYYVFLLFGIIFLRSSSSNTCSMKDSLVATYKFSFVVINVYENTI